MPVEENENRSLAALPCARSQVLGLGASSVHTKEDREKLLPPILGTAEQRLCKRPHFMLSTASRYYAYFIFLYHWAISKEAHYLLRLTIINKIIPKQGKNPPSPRGSAGRGEANNTGQKYGLGRVQEVVNRPWHSVAGLPGAFGESKGKAIWTAIRLLCAAEGRGS